MMSNPNFLKLLSPEAREKAEKRIAYGNKVKAEVELLGDRELADKIEYWQRNSTPPKYYFGELVYDATLWYILIPEVIRRLRS